MMKIVRATSFYLLITALTFVRGLFILSAFTGQCMTVQNLEDGKFVTAADCDSSRKWNFKFNTHTAIRASDFCWYGDEYSNMEILECGEETESWYIERNSNPGQIALPGSKKCATLNEDNSTLSVLLCDDNIKQRFYFSQ